MPDDESKSGEETRNHSKQSESERSTPPCCSQLDRSGHFFRHEFINPVMLGPRLGTGLAMLTEILRDYLS